MKVVVTCTIKKKMDFENDEFAEYDNFETINDLANAIISNGHSVKIIDYYPKIEKELKSEKEKIDLVFNVCEGIGGREREAIVPLICEKYNIPFTASSSQTLINTLDKEKTKEILVKNGINTPKYFVANKSQRKGNLNISFPLIAKPSYEGSSKGIFNENFVKNENNLEKIIRKINYDYNQPALVEEFLFGREFTVGIVGYKNPTILPIVEITYDHLPSGLNPLDSYETKWIHDSPEAILKQGFDPIICPAKMDKKLENKIKEITLAIYKIFDCRDWARTDLRLDKNGEPSILEINALPGFMKDPKENSRLPKAAYALGWTYEKLIGKVIDSARERYRI